MPPQAELKGHVDKRAFLSAHPFFKGLKPELIDQVSSHAIIRVVKAGAVIYGKGDPGDSLFAVITGTVQISVPSVEGKDSVFAQLAAGEIVGEIALLDGRPRSADVAAVTDCELIVINRHEIPPVDHYQLAVGDGCYIGTARSAIKQGDLADDLARRQLSKDGILAFDRRHADLYSSGDDCKEAVPWISLPIDHGAGLHDPGDGVRAYLVDQLGLMALEERVRAQERPLVNGLR